MRPSAPLALSYFLRQHDLVQVQWVKSQLRIDPEHPSETGQLSEAKQQVQSPFVNADDVPTIKVEGLLVIVGGGTVDAALLQDLKRRGAHIIAADGGASDCEKAGIVPEAIIGDMDSLEDAKAWAARTRLIAFKEQETTDFEKCLYATRAPVTLGLGMTGKRFDHTLAALDAVARHGAERWIILVDEEDIALAVSGPFDFTVGAGERVSVHPLGKVRFARSEGLKYPLDGLMLAPGIRTGTSNAAVEGPFSITPETGEDTPWLLIVARRHLPALLARLMPER